jgi:hypothetical protein
MRASLLVLAGLTVLPIAPANATTYRCNSMGWPRFSAVHCVNFIKATHYADCAKKITDLGWTGNDAWWYCSNLGLKD